MRFVSKSPNLLVVLQPGLPANPLSGTPARPTVSIRFKDGSCEVPEGPVLELVKACPALGSDFVAVTEGGRDPFASSRPSAEPQHVITELKYGTPESRKVSPSKNPVPPELQKLIQAEAIALAKEMLPGMIRDTLRSLAEQEKAVSPIADEVQPSELSGEEAAEPAAEAADKVPDASENVPAEAPKTAKKVSRAPAGKKSSEQNANTEAVSPVST